MIVTAGKTNVSVYFYIVGDADNAKPGEPVTGLLFSDIETGGSASYVRQGAAKTDLTLITLASASAAHADGGFILVDNTIMPGVYRCDFADATFVTGVDEVSLQIVIAAGKNAVAAPIKVNITDFDLRTASVAQTADHTAAIADIPTVAEFNVRTLVAANYFDPAADDVAVVTTLTNKTGFALSATGLDLILSTATSFVAIAKAVWDRVISKANHDIPNSAGKKLRQGTALLLDTGTAQAGGTNSITLAAGSSSQDNIYNGSIIILESGTGQSQHHHVISYNGTTKVAIVDEDWLIVPDNTTDYVIQAEDSHDVLGSGLAQAGASGTITLQSTENANDDIMVDSSVVLVSGTGAIQARRITAYNGTTKVASVTPNWTVNPDSTSGYFLYPEIRNNVWDELLTGSTHNIVNSGGKRLRQLVDAGNYEQGLVWLDTIKGISGDTEHDNGTQVAPTDLLTSVNTLLAALPLHGCHVALGSTVDFVAAQTDQEWTGEGWSLTLGGVSINNSTITGADITGISTGVPREIERCRIGNSTFAGGEFTRCDLDGLITLSSATQYDFVGCHQEAVNPIIDFGATVGATTVLLQDFSGKITISNMGQVAGDDNLTFSSGGGELVLDASCVGGTVNLCGTFAFTNNGSGMTINRSGDAISKLDTIDDFVDTEIAAILVDTGTTLDTKINAIKTITDQFVFTVANLIDSNMLAINGSTEAAQDIERSARTIVRGAAATGTLSTITMTTDLTITVNDQYNGRIVIFASDTTTAALRNQATDITDTVMTNGQLTFTALTTAPVNGDTFVIV